MSVGRLPALVAVAALFVGASEAAEVLELARDGRALATVRLAAEARPAEATAAQELVAYLTRVTSAPFELVEDGAPFDGGLTIEIGPTRTVLRLDPEAVRLGPEEWVIRTHGRHLCLYGGRPRGTLYAVYRFLEDRVGVRWWTPYEELVPRRTVLSVRTGLRRGAPSFIYRDIHGVEGPEFLARNRVNGHFTRLTGRHGGAERYGPPSQVHNFGLYVRPAEYFDSHPEYFSEVAGLRHGGDAQLCLTNKDVLQLVTTRLERYIAQTREESLRTGEPAPRLFNVSPNDWGNPCGCAPCSALAAEQGSEAGPLIAFVNALAGAIADRYPEVLIDTLAYYYTRRPPQLQAADNVSIRFSGLQVRDFSKPVAHPDNASFLSALRGWRTKTRHLRVWDYAVVFGEQGELPLPNLTAIADDLRLYEELGVEGIFIQHGSPVAADMRDLKLWVVAKLLEDPARSHRELIEEFTDGYYGRAGRSIRSYLRFREAAARRRPVRIPYQASPEAYTYLDSEFLVRAHAWFDRAERDVAGDPIRARRVYHARLSLDRATLLRWSPLGLAGTRLDRQTIADRYRRTWEAQVASRVPAAQRAAALAEVDRELVRLSVRGNPDGS